MYLIIINGQRAPQRLRNRPKFSSRFGFAREYCGWVIRSRILDGPRVRPRERHVASSCYIPFKLLFCTLYFSFSILCGAFQLVAFLRARTFYFSYFISLEAMLYLVCVGRVPFLYFFNMSTTSIEFILDQGVFYKDPKLNLSLSWT